MKRKAMGIFLSVVLISILLVGCGGSSGKKSGNDDSSGSAPQLETTTVSGTVMAPNDTTITGDVSSWSKVVSLFINSVTAGDMETVVPGAEVTAINFNTNQQVGTLTTTGDDGSYTISDIPKGINLMIIAEKEVNGKRVHLSALIPDVGNTILLDGNQPGEINAATTITALRYSQHRGDVDYNITPIDVENILKEAKALTAVQIGSLDLTVGNGNITTDANGKPKLDQDNFSGFIASTQIPESGHPAAAEAKRMIQDVRNAGIFLAQDINEQVTKQEETAQEIAAFFETVGTEFSEIKHLMGVDFFSQPPGEYNLLLDGTLEEVTVDEGYETADYWEWTINDNDTEHSAYVRLTNLNNIKQESDEPQNDGYHYAIDLTEAIFEYNVNDSTADHYYLGSLTLNNDSNNTIVETVTNSAGEIYQITIPTDPDYDLNGTFHGPESGDVIMNAGLNGSVDPELTGTASLTLTGSLSTEVINANGELAVSISGESDMSLNTPNSAEISYDGDVNLATAELHGDLSADFIKNSVEDELMPENIIFNGRYKDLAPQKTVWDGSLEITADNIALYNPDAADDFIYGNVVFAGEVTHVDYPAVTLDLNAAINKDETGSQTEGTQYIEISYTHGENSLSGEMKLVDTETGETMDLELTNQDNMKFVLTGDESGVTGSITDENDTQAATIDEEQGPITVHYTDGTMETLY